MISIKTIPCIHYNRVSLFLIIRVCQWPGLRNYVHLFTNTQQSFEKKNSTKYEFELTNEYQADKARSFGKMSKSNSTHRLRHTKTTNVPITITENAQSTKKNAGSFDACKEKQFTHFFIQTFFYSKICKQ